MPMAISSIASACRHMAEEKRRFRQFPGRLHPDPKDRGAMGHVETVRVRLVARTHRRAAETRATFTRWGKVQILLRSAGILPCPRAPHQVTTLGYGGTFGVV